MIFWSWYGLLAMLILCLFQFSGQLLYSNLTKQTNFILKLEFWKIMRNWNFQNFLVNYIDVFAFFFFFLNLRSSCYNNRESHYLSQYFNNFVEFFGYICLLILFIHKTSALIPQSQNKPEIHAQTHMNH